MHIRTQNVSRTTNQNKADSGHGVAKSIIINNDSSPSEYNDILPVIRVTENPGVGG